MQANSTNLSQNFNHTSAVKIIIPSQLRSINNGSDAVQIQPCATLREAIEQVPDQIRNRLLHPSGGLQRFVNAYIGDEDARALSDDPLDASVAGIEEIAIIPAIAGG